MGRAVVTLALLVGGATSAGAQEDVSGVDNRALLDAEATADVLAEAKSISAELFTFTHTDLDGHETRFRELTTGELSREYAELFESMVGEATSQQLSLTSTVADAAVRELRGDHAQVLVFLDQASVRADTNHHNSSKAMFVATLQRVDGTWKFSDLDLFEDR